MPVLAQSNRQEIGNRRCSRGSDGGGFQQDGRRADPLLPAITRATRTAVSSKRSRLPWLGPILLPPRGRNHGLGPGRQRRRARRAHGGPRPEGELPITGTGGGHAPPLFTDQPGRQSAMRAAQVSVPVSRPYRIGRKDRDQRQEFRRRGSAVRRPPTSACLGAGPAFNHCSLPLAPANMSAFRRANEEARPRTASQRRARMDPAATSPIRRDGRSGSRA